jgi:hypothetical protein
MKYTKITILSLLIKKLLKIMNEKDIQNIISEAYLASEVWNNYVINRVFIRRVDRNAVDIIAGCINDYGSWWVAGRAYIALNQLRNATARKVARIPIGGEIVIYR